MKRIKSIVLVSLVIIFLGFALFTYADTEMMTFTVQKNELSGLNGDVEAHVNGDTGILFLPGSANPGNLTLSWNQDVKITIGDDPTEYESGEAPIPQDGEQLIYKYGNSSITLKTMVSSSSVEGMFINIDESYDGGHTINEMNNDKDHNATCYGQIVFGDKTVDMTIKGRGNWTWYNPMLRRTNDKLPYNITLYKDEDIEQGIEKYSKKDGVKLITGVKAKKWSLLANMADGSLMRNKIGYDLANDMGIGLDSRYIDVWMNGKYLGNYLMTPKSDYNAPDDGYVLEIDNNLDPEDPYFRLDGLKSAASVENVITVKDIGDNAALAGETADTIQAWMQTMLDAVLDIKSEDYQKYVDIDSWAKFYLIQDYSKNYDIICGSHIMHRDGLTDDDKLVAGPVWDLDNALGKTALNNSCGISSNLQFTADGWYIDAINGYSSFLQFLGKHESFMKRVYEIYNEYHQDFNDMPQDINTQAGVIEKSAAMNFARWDVAHSNYSLSNYSYAQTFGSGAYKYSVRKTNVWDDYVYNLTQFITYRSKFFDDSLTVTTPADGIINGDTTYDIGDKLNLTAETTANAYQWQIFEDGVWKNITGVSGKKLNISTTFDMDGKSIRCIAKNDKGIINTTRVAKIPVCCSTILEPVTISIVHNCQFDKQVPSEEFLKSNADCTHETVYYYSCKCGKTSEGTGDEATFTYGKALGHNFNQTIAEEKYLKTEADCTHAALYYKSCSCGESCEGTESEATFSSGKALGHKYVEEVANATYLKSGADCTHAAEYYRSCKCGASCKGIMGATTFTSGSPLGHKYTNKVVDGKYIKSEADCTHKAVYYMSCVCGESSEGADDDAVFEYGNMTAHKYSQKVDSKQYLASEADCTHAPTYYKSCICGKSSNGTIYRSTFSSGSANGHEYGTTLVKATFNNNGSETERCLHCGSLHEYTLIEKPNAYLTKAAYTYNGNVQIPEVLVSVKNNIIFNLDRDYTVSWSDEGKNVGKHYAVVNLDADRFAGTKTLSYVINPKGTSISKLSRAKKAFTVKWNKQSTKMSSSRITGYQVQYNKSSSFKTGNKTVTIKGYSKTSKKISKLKTKKKYYVRVRTYMKVGNATYYSAWSKSKSVKTK